MLLGTPLGGGELVRAMLLLMVDAYATCAAVLCVVRMMLSPDSARLRLLPSVRCGRAYLMRWAWRLAMPSRCSASPVAAAGVLLGVWPGRPRRFLKFVGLILHVMLIVIVLQCRKEVARRLRARRGVDRVRSSSFGTGSPHLALDRGVLSGRHLARLGGGAAERLGPPDAIRRRHPGHPLVTRLVLIVLLGTVDRLARRQFGDEPSTPLERRLHAYAPAVRGVVTGLVYASPAGAVPGLGLPHRRVACQLRRGAAAFRRRQRRRDRPARVRGVGGANIAVQGRLDRLSADESRRALGAAAHPAAACFARRLLIALLIVVGLTVLSDLGVNIAPLLAGAGVLGIAIGFGSQKLVQDVITGLFLLLENPMQVGDVVTAGGLTGVVEYLSIRSLRLRSEDGSVHVIPFSAVTTVTNMTRDFGQAVIEAQVSYEDDYDEVVTVMQEIVREMRAEPAWAADIREDLEVWGLDRFADSAIVVKARIRWGRSPAGRSSASSTDA